jgi:beta-phosphoglucomutase-like phosphatase (HAD superfamily)
VIDAVIFDVDGTLIDSVDLHAQAWAEALAEQEREVPWRQVRLHIGKGGDQLLPVFLSPAELARFGKKLEKRRSALFLEKYLPRVTAFPAVRELFLRLNELRVRVALASSAKGSELRHYLELTRIADLIHERTSRDDAEQSKPEPDIFEAALRRLGDVHPGRTLVVGDTPYDVLAARRADLRCVGVRCGGWSAQELFQSGCVAVFRDPADLLARFRAFVHA